MRRACGARADCSSGHYEAASASDYAPEYRYNEATCSPRAQHRWPKTVALPLRKLTFWARYVAGLTFVILLVHSTVFEQRVEVIEHHLSHDRRFLGSNAGQALPSMDTAGDAVGRGLSSSSSTQSSSGSHSSGSSRCGGHHTSTHSLNSTLAFLFFTFVVCTMLYHCNVYVPFEWRFPISVVMFITGGLIGLFFLYVTDDDSGHRGNGFDTLIDGIQGAAAMDPHALLYIILPPLLYESASSMDWHVLRKLLPSSILLAVPGVMLNTFLTGCFVKLFVTIGSKSPKWEESWLLGSILSATDPVAVVAALAELGAPKKLSALVEGESLLNDGSAVVCAYVFLEWSSPADPDKFCEGHNGPGTSPRTICVMGYFLQVAIGGTALGVAAGMILYFWLKLVRNLQNSIIEIGLVFTAVYGTFYVAEAVHTSGVLATVTIGFVMAAGGLHRMSHDGRHNHHVNLSQVAYFCNQTAFFVAGIVSSRFMYSDRDSCDHSAASGAAWAELFGLYAVIHLTRALVVVSFWPFLKSWGYGINWKEACIMVYGGLRGAVGLVVGLIVEHHKYIDPDVAQMVAFHTSGIVLLTLFINGSTIDGLYRRLDMYPHNQYRTTHLRKSLVKLEAECQKKGVKQLIKNWYFQDCNLKKILRCVPKFDHIRFNESDVPCADNIDAVKATLNSLAPDAEKFKAKQPKRPSEFVDFGESWRRAKGQEFETKILDLMNKTSDMVERKDLMKNVLNSGDMSLTYRPPENKAQAGFYVSNRSVIKVNEGRDTDDREVTDDSSIEVEMLKVRDMAIIIGVIASEEDICSCRPGDEQVLGVICENSIGFNCQSCDVQFKGPCGEGFVETGSPALIPGDVVSLRFQRQPKGDWEVCFSVSAEGEADPKLVISVPFGPFQPSELYPVVEFRYIDRSKMIGFEGISRSVTRSNPSLSRIGDSTFGVPGSRAEDTIQKVTGAVEDSGKAVLSVAKAGLDVVTGIFKSSKSDEDDVSRIISNDGKHPGAKVHLSFEPQLASDAESINELFHVLFNTVIHEYTEMHEHGVIGDSAYQWLTETIGAGLDCANKEVNAMRMTNFKSVAGVPESETDHAPARRGISFRLSEDVAGKMKQIFSQMRADTIKAKLVGLFEPLIVEYLSLEHMVATPSWQDKLTFGRLKMLGFYPTRSKVECLWAYITAHEEVLHESACMSRFPDLVSCIKALVQLAKQDLQILQQIQPRRYYYSKHVLALRVVMNKRLMKLKKFAASGWMSPADAGELCDELYRRIVQADHFFPQLGNYGVDDSTMASPSEGGKSMSAGLAGSIATVENAWADCELPSPKLEHSDSAKGELSQPLHTIRIASPVDEGAASHPLQLHRSTTPRGALNFVRVMNPHGSKFGLRTPGNLSSPNPLTPIESASMLNDTTEVIPISPQASIVQAETMESSSSHKPEVPVAVPLSVVPTSSAPVPPGVVDSDQ